MSEAITCEACDRGYRLNPDGLHYNDDAGGATWGICRKVTSTNHPTPELLSESALAEIEKRPASAGNTVWCHVPLTPPERDALCATVRALRAEIKEFERTDLVPRSRYNAVDADWREARQQFQDLATRATVGIEQLESTNTALRDQLAELQRRNDTQAESIMEFQAGEKSLRAQLVQVEKERAALLDAMNVARAEK